MNDSRRAKLSWLTSFLMLLLILAAGAYLRTVGLDWDDGQHLHPDERFLTMVESSLVPVSRLGEYFNTGSSTLNPANQGHSFFVYGTLPIFLVRYLAEWLGAAGYGSVYLVGRGLSAAVDLLTLVVVFLIGSRLLGRRAGLLAAAFSAFAVLQIQQSHFFTVDTFLTFFSVLTVYFAVEVADSPVGQARLSSFLWFGAALGMAVASKISAVPVALTLPLAVLTLLWKAPIQRVKEQAPRLLLYLVLAALISLLTFRIFQPYAFRGPGFFNIRLDENWVAGLKALHAQTTGDVDFPPALQWARRPLWFSLQNMVLWGLGIPLGAMAWIGFVCMGVKVVNRKVGSPHLVVWSWTAAYFLWQSLQWNSTMRYQLPIYPLLAVFAGWLIIHLWEGAAEGWNLPRLAVRFSRPTARVTVGLLGIITLLLTAAWGAAFSRIYTTPHPRVEATQWIFEHIPGPANLILNTAAGRSQQLLAYPENKIIQSGDPWEVTFTAQQSGTLERVTFPDLRGSGGEDQDVSLTAVIAEQPGSRLAAAGGQVSLKDSNGAEWIFPEQVPLVEGQTYRFILEVNNPEAVISLHALGIANESSWDDGLPLRWGGYDPFAGIYQGGLNFEMYWDDNPEKLERFLTTLDQADYLLITSSRQWATTTRLPERYPLTTTYYRELMGCPAEVSIERCYNLAGPGTYQGNLGFELVEVFQSKPTLGPITINDQFAEEAFTVYDHPKVFVFQKSEAFQLDRVEDILGGVDLSRVIHLTPKQADGHPGNLMLPADRLDQQRSGGSWSQLFDREAFINRSQPAAVIIWYVVVFGIGLLVYPLMRAVLGGLADGGYPLARTFGLLLLSYLAWLAGSLRVPFQRLTIGMVLLLMAAAGGAAAYRQRKDLQTLWRKRKKYFLIIEGIALAIFLAGLLVRWGNPDLWHPWKGGEKPMDFSYFNAVLKSTSFPPYDPWFAGGYINYYYYGFVLVGTLVKLLGIVPAVAYNLILPTLLMMIGLGGFSLVWNLFQTGEEAGRGERRLPYLAGGAGLLGMIVLGNLGIIRMFLQGLQRLAAGGVSLESAGFFRKLQWTIIGIPRLLGSGSLGYRLDEWYWNPSRAIGAEHGGPITEFPVFTFLYGDLHAHFIALPLTLLALAWAVSLVVSGVNNKDQRVPFLKVLAVSAFGGLAVGVLRPTNTWDFYPYLALGVVAVLFFWWARRKQGETLPWVQAALQVGLFVLLAQLLFRPYLTWYGQGYTSVKGWFGSRTPWNDYFVHWGLFLGVVVTWMGYETIHWMAHTPVSALRKLKEVRELIVALLLLMLATMISQGIYLENGFMFRSVKVIGAGVHIIWFVLPLMVWAAVLLFRPGTPLNKQIVLFLIGTALALTLMVEMIYIEGDIGRMNTVFKFYLQAWTLFAISAAAAFGWLVRSFSEWPIRLKRLWQIGFIILLTGAALYPLLGGIAKVKDRMAPDAPHTLNGMTFMDYASYTDLNTVMDLSQDYRAIRWLQENVPGSPVIIEANQVEYHWGTRYTVYTGLPGVVGWNWHQRQQRTIVPHDWVFERVEDVNTFYDTTDLGFTREVLDRYQVEYFVVGQLERAKYAPEGLEKFPAAEGVLWNRIYEDRETVIYQVADGSLSKE